ncbi:alpha/beta hydrolase [Ligilactobacillus sp. WILCCON 0076]|uniref:Alpha/beta hydrolase n=1 Tax=Ligilactobacillus ubinensis TaxID=2876789 RepID=A0A9X2JM51_9LACO|nr:alpha/beta hydrolase [Ligilactobacillus ubinensis]MCP0887549.1 alpha/beta hydrolase [Ligilactobacillus ubinensis]
MTEKAVKNMDFLEFKESLAQQEGVHFLTATGKEMYGIYKHDVVYEEVDGIKRTLQLVIPETKEAEVRKYPLLLWVQGSAWLKQDNYKRLTVMARLAQKGFVAGILQYRESSLAAFPAPVEDAKAGIRFLRAHADEYKVDANNVFILGDSSGGHTALLTAFTQGQKNVLDSDLYSEYSAEVNAVVAFNPVTDICQPDFPTTPNQGKADSPEGMEIGNKDVYENPTLSEKLICTNYISEKVSIPPVLLMHGAADDTVSYNQSIRLYKKLLETRKDATFYVIEGAKHGDVAYYTDENLDRVEAFIRGNLRK